ncbi:MAG: alpha/beta hydrolase [Candidatus Rokuibacteriota bacterium]|nr:MAG: alpha/beta hydrolase [Candidatus Rokubacteria bacterium]
MGQPIFRTYDREALDREYDNRAKVADSPRYLAWYASESAAARAALPGRLDVPYGPSPPETLDVFPAAGAEPAPVQVFIHGGYWRALDKSDFSFVARAFHLDAVVVVINYGLIPAVDMDELVRQCRQALAWVYRNARMFGGDPARIFVSGHSAGGHLVAMSMATDWRAFAGLPADLVKGGAAVSGLYDLEPIRLCYLNETLTLGPAEARRNSPVELAPVRVGPLLLTVGGLEGPEYHRQTDELARAWRARGVACTVMEMPGLDHFSIVAQLNERASKLSRTIRAQMGLV